MCLVLTELLDKLWNFAWFFWAFKINYSQILYLSDQVKVWQCRFQQVRIFKKKRTKKNSLSYFASIEMNPFFFFLQVLSLLEIKRKYVIHPNLIMWYTYPWFGLQPHPFHSNSKFLLMGAAESIRPNCEIIRRTRCWNQ